MSKKRDFLMLAHPYREAKHGDLTGWFMSEKLDGMRAFWDGGFSRGVAAQNVPWANTIHDSRFLNEQIATGLWTRQGNIIHAPDFFLDRLPPFPLDGELLDNCSRQTTLSIVKQQYPDERWHDIVYYVFESPPLSKVCGPGVYRAGAKELVNVDSDWYQNFIDEQIERQVGIPSKHLEWSFAHKPFEEIVVHNEGWSNLLETHQVQFLKQTRIESMDHMYAELARTRKEGGEGLILRKARSSYECKRSHNMLKLKNISFGEATVIGYTTGRATDRGSKLLGLMGAVICSWQNKRFEISGFTESERILHCNAVRPENGPQFFAKEWATRHPEQECPSHIINTLFPPGSQIPFIYRGLTNGGVPQEARYFRGKR